MKIALFVEGSVPHGDRDRCAELWNNRLLPALGRSPVDHVIPIGKDAITLMRGLRASSRAAPLDLRIDQARQRFTLNPERDALIIAWDLEPIDRGQRRCAWDEKIALYRGIASSTLLRSTSPSWCTAAAGRESALRERRGVAPDGQSRSAVRPGSVLALCMEPMFDTLLVRSSAAVRRALGLHRDPPDWPSGWGQDQRNPSDVLKSAIAALRAQRPRATILRKIREPWENAKDEWSELLLRELFQDPREAQYIADHPIARRLAHILPQAP